MIESMDTKYAYAVARIRAIEQRMLAGSLLEQMIVAESADAAFKLLTAAGYDSSDGSVFNYEQVLSAEMEEVYDLLMEIAPDPQAFDLFFIKNDYHNLKVHLKAEFLNQPVQASYLGKPSLHSPSVVAKIFQKRDFAKLPKAMAEAVEACYDAFNKTGDPQLIDIICDQALYQEMLRMANKLKNPFVKQVIGIMIDLVNLKIVLRTKILAKSWEFLSQFLIDGGSFERDFYQELFALDFKDFPSAYEKTDYHQLLVESMTSFTESKSLGGFEMLSDNYIIKLLKQTKFAIFGIEPLVTYLLAKEMEIKNVRIIMVGKINQLAQAAIRERLRDTYV